MNQSHIERAIGPLCEDFPLNPEQLAHLLNVLPKHIGRLLETHRVMNDLKGDLQLSLYTQKSGHRVEGYCLTQPQAIAFLYEQLGQSSVSAEVLAQRIATLPKHAEDSGADVSTLPVCQGSTVTSREIAARYKKPHKAVRHALRQALAKAGENPADFDVIYEPKGRCMEYRLPPHLTQPVTDRYEAAAGAMSAQDALGPITAPIEGESVTASGVALVSSLRIAAMVGQRHKHVLRQIRERFTRSKFAPREPGAFPTLNSGEVWEAQYAVEAQAPQPHLLLLETDAMVFVAKIKPEYAGALAEHIATLRQTSLGTQLQDVPATLETSDIRRLARQVLEDERTIEVQAAKITKQTHALSVYERADGALGLRDAAKSLGVPEKQLIARLIDSGWLYRRKGGDGKASGSLAPMATRVKSGHMAQQTGTHTRADGKRHNNVAPLILLKGLHLIAARLKAEAEMGPQAPTIRSGK